MSQALAATYYMAKYVSKNSETQAATLSLIQAAQQHIQDHPSVASDSGTIPRTAKHLLTRFLNSMTGRTEVSRPMAALALMDTPANLFSHSFQSVHVFPASAYLKQLIDARPAPMQVDDPDPPPEPILQVNDAELMDPPPEPDNADNGDDSDSSSCTNMDSDSLPADDILNNIGRVDEHDCDDVFTMTAMPTACVRGQGG